jgi:hypothetical protein
MKYKKLFVLPMLAIGVLVLCATANAQDSDKDKDKLGPYKLLTTVTLPEELVGFDISWVDSEAGRYYLANRGTGTTPAKPNITVIDTRHNKFLSEIPMPIGPDGQNPIAPNGVVAIHGKGDDDEEDSAGTLVVGGTQSEAVFIDLAHPLVPVLVPTGGTGRADELAFDPKDHLILIANDRAADLFVTLISTEKTPHVVGKIFYNGSTPGNPIACEIAVPATNCGIEQPVWDKKTKKFYLAIPATVAHPNGEVDEIDPNAMPASGDIGQGKITRIFPTSCGPAGLVLIPGQRLMTSCGDVLDTKDGSVVHTVLGVGGDEIWFNSGDERVYFGGGLDRISVPVVDALKYNVITTLTVGQLSPPNPPPSHTTHSVAADSELNRVFVPVSHEGVKVYTDATGEGPDN